MNDNLMPGWMKKEQQQTELKQARAEASLQREEAAARLIELKSPEFWKQLQEKIGIAVEFLPKLQMRGQMSTLADGSLRISVGRPGKLPNHTYTDLGHSPYEIRCTTATGDLYKLLFCAISGTEVAVVLESSAIPQMNPDQAAEYIMRRMVEIIETGAPMTR